MNRATATFPGMPGQATLARQWLASWLGDRHPASDTVVLLLSEAFTNSCLHSRSAGPDGRIGVTAELIAQLVRVEVIDAGGGPASLVAIDASGDAENGRGLWMLDLLSKEWGSEELPDGRRRVHFTVAF